MRLSGCKIDPLHARRPADCTNWLAAASSFYSLCHVQRVISVEELPASGAFGDIIPCAMHADCTGLETEQRL
ncbi:MAG: hypothetical protein DMF17_03215, partial [Verrucomicrobia bacterium]